MSEYSDMLTHSVGGLFAGFSEAGDPAAMWQSAEDLGIADLLLPADEGGMDGSWQDAALVWRLAGLHATSLPVGETMIARRLLCDAGLHKQERTPIVLAKGVGELGADGRFSGVAHARSPSIDGAQLLIDLDGQCILFDGSETLAASDNSNMAGESRPLFTLRSARGERIKGIDLTALFHAGAILRASQVAGALDTCLEICLRYVSERSQFGRELKRFQVIQHQIAVLAAEAAAVNSASASAASAMDSEDWLFEAACAKLRANLACGASALVAHQMHGAIGMTAEYGLQRFTRRLWAWRGEFGNDRYWAEQIGESMLTQKAISPWARLSGTSDI